MLCSSCGIDLKDVKAKVRQHIGCPAGCGGIMMEQTVGLKCPRCGIFVSAKSL